MLESDSLPDMDAIPAQVGSGNWVPLRGNTHIGGIGTRLLRLDINVTYSGSQKPLLYIPYAFVPNLKIGLVANGRLLMWRPMLENLESEGGPAQRTFGMVVLPITAPGEYQLLVQGSAVANAAIIRGAKLNLDQNFVLRDYPASISTASAIMGALSTFLIFCTAVIFYRFRVEFVYTLVFLIGAFASILLREGVLFLSWNLDASWWVVHLLPLAIGMCNAGAMYYACSNVPSSKWRLAQKLVRVAGGIALFVGVLNVFLPGRDNQYYSVPGFILVMAGTLIALVLVLLNAWQGGSRERLFALFIAPYFAVSIGRFFAAAMQATVNISPMPMYLTFYLFGVYVFVEYIVSLTREYVEERARRSADMARVDLVNRFSHELRTPLNAVIGLADLMKSSKNSERGDSSNIGNYANMIQSAGNTLLGLVNDILDFSKLGATGIPLVQQPVRLDRMMTEVLTGFVPQALETGIIPKVEMGPDVPFFLIGDELRLKQIFGNLVNNAVKFSYPNQFVTVAINRGAVAGDRIELLCQVKDSGRGIPLEKQEDIFEPYTQVAPEDSGELRGTGLGLAICKLLIEQMGGHIKVHSECKRGTTFTFNIWLTVDKNAPDLDACFEALRGRRILILSNLAAVTEYLPQFLLRWGARVDIAARGEQAGAGNYDLVLVESMYRDASANIDFLNNLAPSTVIEIVEIRPSDWPGRLTHPNVHRLMVPISLLNLLAAFAEHLGGKPVNLGEREAEVAELQQLRHHVLLVDDNVVNLTVASKLLESLGVSCETAKSGRGCLEKLPNHDDFSLILLDCEMPDLSGFEVCRRWRAFEAEADKVATPIVALTAHALTEVRERCMEVGMNEVLFKPIGRSALIELLNRVPGRRA